MLYLFWIYEQSKHVSSFPSGPIFIFTLQTPPCKPAYLVIINVTDAKTNSKPSTAPEYIKFMQLPLKVINMSGKDKGLVFLFKSSLRHNIIFMLFTL